MDRPISPFNKALISDAYEQNRRTREAITSNDWNNLFNQHRFQGNHSENYLEELDHYLFGYTNPETEEFNSGALISALEDITSLQTELGNHETNYENPHQVVAEQVNANAILGVTGGHVQAILEDLKLQVDTKMSTSAISDTYETKADAALHIVNVSVNETNGVFTFTRNNGTTFTVDTALEKIATNWYFNSTTQKLELTLKDGTVQEVDLSAFVKPNEFVDSADIVWTTNGTTVSCSIASAYKNTMQSLKTAAEDAALRAEVASSSATNSATSAFGYSTAASNSATAAEGYKTTTGTYMSTTESYKLAASTSATSAANSALEAESYAHGDTDSRVGEDTDNAKYYMERSAYWAGQSAEGQLQADWNQTDTASKDFIKNKPTIPEVDQTYSATSANAVSGVALASRFADLASADTTNAQNITNVANNLGNVNSLTTTAKVAVGAINELNNSKRTIKSATSDTKEAVAATLQEGEFLYVSDEDFSVPVSIIDNLTSTDTDKALSANQGKTLKDLIDVNAVSVLTLPVPITGASAQSFTSYQIPNFATSLPAGAKVVSMVAALAQGSFIPFLKMEQSGPSIDVYNPTTSTQNGAVMFIAAYTLNAD